MKFQFPLFLALFVFLLSSCKEEEQQIPVSTWQLIEILSDPGDGSGVFASVNSDKLIEFYDDGTVCSTGDLCFMGAESSTPSTGVFSVADSTISGADCNTSGYHATYSHQSNFLILHYPCIEACEEKYIEIIIN